MIDAKRSAPGGNQGRSKTAVAAVKINSTPRRAPSERAPLTEQMVRAWADALTGLPKRIEYWSRRGISVDTLRQLKIGWDSARNCYTIPVYNADGELVDCKIYKPRSAKKNTHTKGWGSPCRLYGADRLVECEADERVYLCAGEPDAILMASLGYLAVSGTSGEGSVPRDEDLELLRGRSVAILYDVDAAGRLGAAKMVDALRSIAKQVRDVELPFRNAESGKDVTDWFKLGHPKSRFLRVMFKTKLEWPADRRPVAELVEDAMTRVTAGEGRNDTGLWLSCQLRDERYTYDETEAALIEEYRPRVTDLKDSPYTEDEARASVVSAFTRPPRERAPRRASSGDAVQVQHPADVMANARQFVSDEFDHTDHTRIVFALGKFFAWDGSAYVEIPEKRMRTLLYLYFEHAVYPDDDETKAFQPGPSKISALIDGLTAVTMPNRDADAPTWLGDRPEGTNARDQFIACSNGILHVESRRLLKSTPSFFNLDARPFAYDGDAAVPQVWLRFLGEVLPDDREAIDGLQEWFGYVLGGDTSKQKMALLVGPPRSGKGTIARVLRGLVGETNTASPTMKTLNGEFGAAALIGKALAVVPDARIDNATSGAKELLLAISGEDSIEVNRKNRDHVSVKLGARVMILTNELPRFTDASAAIASRFLIWEFKQSFLGREDDSLATQLLAELPGIFNWALAGLDRLNARRHFVLHASGRVAIRELSDLYSPVSVFVRECAVIDPKPDARATPDAVWEEWRTWCLGSNYPPGSKQTFHKDLRAAVPGLDRVRLRVGRVGTKPGPNDRVRVYNRVGLRAKPTAKFKVRSVGPG